LQGLAQRLHPAGVTVLDVKPGFVDTPMTANMPKGLLWAKPEQIARAIDLSIRHGRAEVYAPRFWWWIMLLIRLLPTRLFLRLRL
jgi:short-subunit dehydrogenase